MAGHVYSVTMANQIVLRMCAVCGKGIRTANPRALYCGTACNSKAYRKRLPPDRLARRLALARARSANRRVVLPDYERTWHMRRYGLGAGEYDSLFVAQGGVCAACGMPEVAKRADGKVYRLAVDHDHETDAVRGLLCGGCNLAIGHLREDPDRAEAIARYLRRTK